MCAPSRATTDAVLDYTSGPGPGTGKTLGNVGITNCNSLPDVCLAIAALIRRHCKLLDCHMCFVFPSKAPSVAPSCQRKAKWKKEEFNQKLEGKIKLLTEAVCILEYLQQRLKSVNAAGCLSNG